MTNSPFDKVGKDEDLSLSEHSSPPEPVAVTFEPDIADSKPQASSGSSPVSSASSSLRRRSANAGPSTYRKQLEHIHKDCASGQPTIHRVYDPLSKDIDEMTSESGHGGGPESWVEKHRENIKSIFSFKQRSCCDFLENLLPMVGLLKTYDWRKNVPVDILAGLTVGVMIVPQSMSYAKLAGLPVEFGLYSSLVPIYAYALFGTSRQLAVGPVALVSLILNNGLSLVLSNAGKTPENTENYDELYATLAIQTSFLVGICYIIMGVLKLGFVTIFLSHSVVSGFTSAAAIIIGLSQVKYIFGYEIPSDKSLHMMLKNIFANIAQFNYKTFLLGTLCVAFLLGMKQVSSRFSNHPVLKWGRAAAPLLVTIITIALQAIIDLESNGIPIVKEIPQGLPKFSIAQAVRFDEIGIGQLSVLVLSIVIVGFMESIAIAKQLASKHNYELDSSKELLGLGVANLSAGLFSGYPMTGSFSRSAVNNEVGAKSGISAIVTATLVLIVLLFLTPIFELMSLPTLASIVISGVYSLVELDEAFYLWKVHKFDFGVWMFAFLGTLFLGIELGLGIAIGLSLFLVIFESAYPHTAILGRLPGTTEYRNIKNYDQAECYDGIVVVRVDGPIYFANTQNVRDKVQKYVRRATNDLESKQLYDTRISFVIIEMSAVAHVDTSALHILEDMAKTYAANNIKICFTNPNKKVMEKFVGSGLAEEIGRQHIFVSTHDAVAFCLQEMDSDEMTRQSSGEQFPVMLTNGSTDDVMGESDIPV